MAIQAEELAEIKWATEEEIQRLIAEGRFVPNFYNDTIFRLAKTDEATI